MEILTNEKDETKGGVTAASQVEKKNEIDETPGGVTATSQPKKKDEIEEAKGGVTAEIQSKKKDGIRDETNYRQSYRIRNQSYADAMSWKERVRRRLTPTNARKAVGSPDAGENGTPTEAGRSSIQYRIEAVEEQQPPKSILRRVLGWFCLGFLFGKPKRSTLAVGVNPNQKLAMYLHWMFRVNFIFLFTVMCMAFFASVLLFAAVITIVAHFNKSCVRVGPNEFDAFGTGFADAFALSWTTFSTVGYGAAYTALGYQSTNPKMCFLVNFICSLEALVGVVYGGFCGAILFGKVLRIQSHAQVIFSDPVLIRYGSGLYQADRNDAEPDEEGDQDEEADAKIPCPVLEFRIVNRLYNETGGEIMDASLTCVASINSANLDPNNIAQQLGLSDRNYSSGSDNGYSLRSDTSQGYANSLFFGNGKSDRSFGSKTLRFLKSYGLRSQTVDEDPTSGLITKHTFSKLYIEASNHPFFKRVWLARHTLNEESPILKPRMRRRIRRNGGFWPSNSNNYAAIRDSLSFTQILVSLNGVSNISASDVYAQKIYDMDDINVGYQFVNLLYREPDGSLGVDTDLVNDVREQNGGGGEPLHFG